MYYNLTQLLPKFLWKHIVEYLSLKEIRRTCLLNLYDIYRDDECRDLFMNNRSDAITVVRCERNRIDNFWKYACANYVPYDNVDFMLKSETNSKHIIYLKVFMKPGMHMVSTFKYIFNNVQNIEINGSVTNESTLISCEHTYPRLQLENIIFLSLKRILFRDIELYVDGIRGRYSELCISKCTFNCDVFILTKHAFVDKCKFDRPDPADENERLGIALRLCLTDIQDKLATLKYIISNNTFINVRECISWSPLPTYEDDFFRDIKMIGNIVTNSSIFFGCYEEDVLAIIKDNCITNTNVCVRKIGQSRIVIENNDFINTMPFEDYCIDDVSTDKNNYRGDVILLINNRSS